MYVYIYSCIGTYIHIHNYIYIYKYIYIYIYKYEPVSILAQACLAQASIRPRSTSLQPFAAQLQCLAFGTQVTLHLGAIFGTTAVADLTAIPTTNGRIPMQGIHGQANWPNGKTSTTNGGGTTPPMLRWWITWTQLGKGLPLASHPCKVVVFLPKLPHYKNPGATVPVTTLCLQRQNPALQPSTQF